MSAELDRLWQESTARVYARATELLEANDDWSVYTCIQLAMMEEVLLHGTPSESEPIGILRGESFLRRDRQP